MDTFTHRSFTHGRLQSDVFLLGSDSGIYDWVRISSNATESDLKNLTADDIRWAYDGTFKSSNLWAQLVAVHGLLKLYPSLLITLYIFCFILLISVFYLRPNNRPSE